MPEKIYDVRYNGTFGENYRHYEDFDVAGKKIRVEFDRETKIAKNVPEQVALRLNKSEAFDIINKDGNVKPVSAPPPVEVHVPGEPQVGGKLPAGRGTKAKA